MKMNYICPRSIIFVHNYCSYRHDIRFYIEKRLKYMYNEVKMLIQCFQCLNNGVLIDGITSFQVR